MWLIKASESTRHMACLEKGGGQGTETVIRRQLNKKKLHRDVRESCTSKSEALCMMPYLLMTRYHSCMMQNRASVQSCSSWAALCSLFALMIRCHGDMNYEYFFKMWWRGNETIWTLALVAFSGVLISPDWPLKWKCVTSLGNDDLHSLDTISGTTTVIPVTHA